MSGDLIDHPNGVGRSVASVVKGAVELAGLDPAIFSGHSLRSGFITSAAKHGASIFEMMDVSRHKSVETLRGYVRDAEAMRWFRLAAKQGYASAQSNIGSMYGRGEGVPQNDVEAAKWYLLAAAGGNAIAQDNLGTMYAKGHGVQQNYAEAAKWYRLAAEQGYVTAQSNLGFMYSYRSRRTAERPRSSEVESPRS